MEKPKRKKPQSAVSEKTYHPGITPEWVRIPSEGCFCPYTSLSRQKIKTLIKEKSIKASSVPTEGRTRSLRLVHLPSLLQFINSQMEAAK